MTEQDPIDPRLAAALSSVEDPELRRPLIDLGMLRAARLDPDGTAVVEVLLTISGCPLRSTIETDVAEAVRGVDGVHRTVVELDVMTPQQREELKDRLGHTRTIPFADPTSLTRVHSVTSGKGGVGKSTVTANLAAALAARGRSVGVVDADIHGFSIPGLFGITAGPTKVDEMILPPVVEVPDSAASEDGASRAADGHRRGSVRAISIGMFTDPANPVVWRGPLLDRAVEQFLADVHFGDLDHLLLDLPPGTGDVAIAVAQKLPGSGVLVVSTPQQAAAGIAERSGALAAMTDQTVSGVIENMSAMVMPDGSSFDLFGSGGGEQIADSLTRRMGYDVPLLGSIPLDIALRQAGDAGMPLVWSDPEAPASQVLRGVAARLDGPRGLEGRSLGITPR
ncbi:MAG: Mrp/NBP35 family ATP-binding protein [Micrococcales bacterium]|uniref:P-loop NTPase n=1 Tax=Kocuria TaxID=57493 RepID=UPI00045EBEAB|nr:MULTISPECIES: P-loop NTPase [Kocuria]MDN5703340.1 Mrp/NBP35 family ATP-binding protein [Micrococcales bacterium]ALB02799.1 sodium:proton antiporter [Kocuria palustris]MBM7823766.1 ATP-binding protein involved in chromosome partitioning [Kocuria palustris]MCM3331614.1 Mrp/NBP35 family ATP-binding protein [Kocuria palustris]MCT1835064.1 Mrp/NBP35 family ATP-binding protein [Kocuria palustris]